MSIDDHDESMLRLKKYKMLLEYQLTSTSASTSRTEEEDLADDLGYDPSQMASRGTLIPPELLEEFNLSPGALHSPSSASADALPPAGRWSLFRILTGSHRGWVRCLSVDPSNQFFVSGSNDTTIKVWNLGSGELSLTLTGHTDAVRALLLDHARPYLYSAAEDKEVKCWDLTTNQVSRHFHGHAGGVYALARHPELDLLVSGGRDKQVRLWDVRMARQIMPLPGHTGSVLAVACQADEPQVISAGADKRIRFWDLAGGKAAAILTHHQNSVRALALHPVDWAFASAGADGVKKFQCPKGEYLRSFAAPERQRYGPNITNALAVNEALLVGGNDAGVVNVWDWDSGKCLQQIKLPLQKGSLLSESAIHAISFDQTGYRLIAACADKTIKILKLESNQLEDDF